MKKSIFKLIFLLFLVSACKTTQKSSAVVTPGVELVLDKSYRNPVRDKEIFNSTNDAVPLDTVYVIQDTLYVFTKPVIGCSAESFKLLWNGAISKSQPPKTQVKLLEILDASCRQKHKFHLTYNITHFRSKLDTASTKVTLFSFGGWKRDLKYPY